MTIVFINQKKFTFSSFSKTSKLPKFCQGTFLVMTFIKTDRDVKNEPHFLIRLVMGLQISDVYPACISYSDQYQL